MAGKLHTLVEARSAKQSVLHQLQDIDGVSLGIGQTENGNDYAVVVMVKDEMTARSLPKLSADLPVKIKVVGKVSAL